jgi:hypothetical protein
VPSEDGDSEDLSFTIGDTKTSDGIVFGLYQELLEKNFLIGYKNTTDTATTTFRIQNLNLASDTRVAIDADTVTTEVQDGSGNAFNSESFDPESQAYSVGSSYTIPYEQIVRVERLAETIKIWYSTGSHLLFSMGTVDTTEIDRIILPVTAGGGGAGSPAATTITQKYFTLQKDLDVLESKIYEAIILSQGADISVLDYDTTNFTVSNVAS